MRKKIIVLTIGALGVFGAFWYLKKPTYPDTIKGQIVTLKKLTIDSARDYYTMFSDNVRKLVEFPENITKDYINEHIRIKFEKMQKGLKIAYNIWNNRDNRMVGALEIRKKDTEDPGQPGQFEIWLNEKYRGGGRAQEAMYLISKAYFEVNPTIKSYNAYVRPWNPRSLRALEKFGFKKVTDRIEDGKVTDHVLELYRNVIEEKTKTKGGKL